MVTIAILNQIPALDLGTLRLEPNTPYLLYSLKPKA